MTWRPILERKRVAPVLAEIVAALDEHARSFSELADYAVVRSYLASDGAVADDDDRGGAALAAAIDALAGQTAQAGLFGGATRIGWTVAHLAGGDDAEAVCSAIDRALLRQLDSWDGDYDLISGLVGFGVYALERGEAGAAIARGALAGLEAYAAAGWLTPPRLLTKDQLAETPDGHVNLGIAHGIPGAIALAARFYQRGIEPARAAAVLTSALRCLLDSSPRRPRGRFAGFLAAEPSQRLAWCYGDLGVAAALLGAGLWADHAEARAEALAVALDCAERTVDEARAIDAAICHGAAGIAHLFLRMAAATGEPALRAAAARWLETTLTMRRSEPLAGFPATHFDHGVPRLAPDASLLAGAAGVALVLHAASSEVEPAWDRLLLVDLP